MVAGDGHRSRQYDYVASLSQCAETEGAEEDRGFHSLTLSLNGDSGRVASRELERHFSQ